MHDQGEILGLRLALAFNGGDREQVAAALIEVLNGCAACGADAVLVVLGMLSARVDASVYRREILVAVMGRLAELLPPIDNSAGLAEMYAQLGVKDQVDLFDDDGEWTGWP
jgi:hypothetical protein